LRRRRPWDSAFEQLLATADITHATTIPQDVSMYWTKRAIADFWRKDWGWLLVTGNALFCVRSSTLWLSRLEGAAPSVKEIGEQAAILATVQVATVLLWLAISLLHTMRDNKRWLNRFRVSESEFADILRASLVRSLGALLVAGIPIAWAMGVNIFGGVLDSILTAVEITAGAAPILRKLMDG
jgi:hypothetical protein